MKHWIMTSLVVMSAAAALSTVTASDAFACRHRATHHARRHVARHVARHVRRHPVVAARTVHFHRRLIVSQESVVYDRAIPTAYRVRDESCHREVYRPVVYRTEVVRPVLYRGYDERYVRECDESRIVRYHRGAYRDDYYEPTYRPAAYVSVRFGGVFGRGRYHEGRHCR